MIISKANLVNRFLLICLSTILFTATVLSFVKESGKVTSNSVDIAHAYALINEYVIYGKRTTPRDYLGEMNYYPGGSHWLVAKLSLLFKGDIILALSYWIFTMLLMFTVSILILMIEGKYYLREIIVAPLCLFGFSILRTHGLFIEESIRGNFFFSQLTGTSIMLFLFTLVFKTAYEKVFLRMVLVIILIWICAYIHLLPALMALSACFVYSIIEIAHGCLRDRDSFKTLFIRNSTEILSYGIFAATLILYHPSYAVMKDISATNGVLRVPIPTEIFILASTALFVLFCLFYFLMFTYKRIGFSKNRIMLLSFFLGSVLMMLAQWFFLYKYNVGSEYAIKKHFYGVSAFFVICLVGVFFDLLNVIKAPRLVMDQITFYNYFLVIAIFLTGQFFQSSAAPFPYKDHLLIKNKLTKIPISTEGETLFINSPITNSLPYLINIGDLHAERNQVTYALLTGNLDEVMNFLHVTPHVFRKVVLGNKSLLDTYAKILSNYTVYDLNSGKELVLAK